MALRERGVDSKPYLPAIHLMSFYRERFGHREGEFPVCEDVAARSLALPFFPELTEGEVEQVVEALRGRSSVDRLDERHEAGQPSARRAVGHLVEARTRVEGPCDLVVERRVERHRAKAEPGASRSASSSSAVAAPRRRNAGSVASAST